MGIKTLLIGDQWRTPVAEEAIVGLYQAGKLPINKLMGERLKLEDINQGFDRMASGEAMRDVIVF